MHTTRRSFLALTAGSLTAHALPSAAAPLAPDAPETAATELPASLDAGWQFHGRAAQPSPPISVTLPHCPAKLSWQDWNAELWEDVFLYSLEFPRPQTAPGHRTFLHFDAAMVAAAVTLNGHALPRHKGGYLPFQFEITSLLETVNHLEVQLDGHFQDVPPEGSPKGRSSVDYFVPAMLRGVSLTVVPPTYVSDVFAKPVDVLSPDRRIDLLCTLDSATASAGEHTLVATLHDGVRQLARQQFNVTLAHTGATEARFSLHGLEQIELWDCDHPKLYHLRVALHKDGSELHATTARLGFREAKFTVDGFFLNGRKMQFFGLNRHELFPYTGYAMPAGVMRRDAEILRRELNCNIVRCSHYPQHQAFLDACDELGLMVWEEPPGWQYIGDQAFQDQVVENVRDMILRDRNHPSIVIWGVRVNESHNDPLLYNRTYALARQLDDSRPTSGSMTGFDHWQTEWHEDVFAYDDYRFTPDQSVQIRPPLEGVPYMLAETVGQYSYTVPRFDNKYRRAADPAMQMHQAIYHAQAHNQARAYDRMGGVIAWCAFEYGSPQNSWKGVKNPGVCDVFRIPKLGATFYQSQISPQVRPVIAANFFWDFGPTQPRGPGKNVAIFHNCDRLEVFIANQHHATLTPDRAGYPHLAYPPSWVDLDLDGSALPELRIEGIVAGRRVLARRFSSDPAHDQLELRADDARIVSTELDATRVTLQILDRYGAPRLHGSGDVTLTLNGPGEWIGDSTLSLAQAGGAAAVWVRSQPPRQGTIQVTATHPVLGARSLSIVSGPRAGTPRAGL